jgi:hypothetical protein
MDSLKLLQDAHAAGLEVTVEAGRLRIRGPRRAAPIAQRIIANKVDVVSLLTVEPAPTIGPGDLPGDWRIDWEERAAVMEYDGGFPRERAEALTLTEIINTMERAGIFLRPDTCI